MMKFYKPSVEEKRYRKTMLNKFKPIWENFINHLFLVKADNDSYEIVLRNYHLSKEDRYIFDEVMSFCNLNAVLNGLMAKKKDIIFQEREGGAHLDDSIVEDHIWEIHEVD